MIQTVVKPLRRAERLNTPTKQRGISMIAVFLLLAVAVFFGTFAFKVGPNYIEYMTVSTIADDVAGNPDLLQKPKSAVVSYIEQAYRTNNLWDLKAEETIKLSKDAKRGYLVTVDYEKRDNLFANIYVVTAFNKEAGAH